MMQKKIINEIKNNNYDELIWLKRNQKRINNSPFIIIINFINSIF